MKSTLLAIFLFAALALAHGLHYTGHSDEYDIEKRTGCYRYSEGECMRRVSRKEWRGGGRGKEEGDRIGWV
jgi:hypothetical protein